MKETRKVIYYSDPLGDEFSTAKITPKRIDGNYKYIRRGPFRRFTHFFWYRIVGVPLAWIYLKVKFAHRIENKRAIKPYKKTGYFIYGNHTQAIADALIPTFVCAPKDVFVIVHANNVSMPFLGRVTPSMGALPLPDDAAATRNFIRAVTTRIEQGKTVCIYPEKHIWPYYTDIRPFRSDSMRYPAKLLTPVFCFTNTYTKKRRGKGVRIVTYIDGPFFPDETLPIAERKEKLRQDAYTAMKKRAEKSTVRVIEYKEKIPLND